MKYVNFSFNALKKDFEHYIDKANKELTPIFFSFSSIIISTNNLFLKHSLAILTGIIFIIFVKENYPEKIRIIKRYKKYLKDTNPQKYVCIEGTISYFESWSFFVKRGLPMASSYTLFFLTWLFTT